MKMSRTIAECVVCCVIFAAPGLRMHAQDNQPPERKKRSTEGTPQQQQRRGQDSPQRTAAPSQQAAPQHERREVDRSERRQHTPPSGQPAQGQAPQSQPQTQQRPQPAVQTPQTRDAQPGRTYGDRPAAERPATQPGRTFGDRPAAQPGRTFGNPPGREAEPQRGQSQIGAPVAGFSFPYLHQQDRRRHPSRFEGGCAAGPHDEWHRGVPSTQRAAARRGSQAGWTRGGRECAGSRLCAAPGGGP